MIARPERRPGRGGTRLRATWCGGFSQWEICPRRRNNLRYLPTKIDFERTVRAEARKYAGPKEGHGDGLEFWNHLARERDLEGGCKCHTCRSDPWQHVKSVLRRCGFSHDAT